MSKASGLTNRFSHDRLPRHGDPPRPVRLGRQDACRIERIAAEPDRAKEQDWHYGDPNRGQDTQTAEPTGTGYPLTSNAAFPVTTVLTPTTRGETAKVEALARVIKQ